MSIVREAAGSTDDGHRRAADLAAGMLKVYVTLRTLRRPHTGRWKVAVLASAEVAAKSDRAGRIDNRNGTGNADQLHRTGVECAGNRPLPCPPVARRRRTPIQPKLLFRGYSGPNFRWNATSGTGKAHRTDAWLYTVAVHHYRQDIQMS